MEPADRKMSEGEMLECILTDSHPLVEVEKDACRNNQEYDNRDRPSELSSGPTYIDICVYEPEI